MFGWRSNTVSSTRVIPLHAYPPRHLTLLSFRRSRHHGPILFFLHILLLFYIIYYYNNYYYYYYYCSYHYPHPHTYIIYKNQEVYPFHLWPQLTPPCQNLKWNLVIILTKNLIFFNIYHTLHSFLTFFLFRFYISH